MQKDIKALIDVRKDLKMELRRVEEQLAEEVTKFDGTLIEALDMGLVKLNFSLNPWVRRKIFANRI